MTAADWIAVRREKEQAATEGPWEAWDRGIGFEVHVDSEGLNSEFRETFRQADAEFIADARTSLPAALDALEAALALHCSAPLFSVDGRDCEVHGTACEDNVPVCVACIDCEGEAETYPCPTVRAITEALGVES